MPLVRINSFINAYVLCNIYKMSSTSCMHYESLKIDYKKNKYIYLFEYNKILMQADN